MRILAIGDPHGKIPKNIPRKNIDLILLTGDIGKADLMRKYAFAHVEDKESWVYLEPKKIVREAFLEAYNSSLRVLRYLSTKAPVYLIYGNVETSDADTRKLSNKLGVKLPLLGERLKTMNDIHIINNKIVKLENLVFAGSEYFVETDWVRRFSPKDKRRMKDARKETDRAKKFYSKLKKVDILLCHQPPYGVLDKVSFFGAPKHWSGKHAGSKVILDYIKKYHPKYVVCGHIHEAAGRKRLGKTEVINLGMSKYKIIEI